MSVLFVWTFRIIIFLPLDVISAWKKCKQASPYSVI
jgi:hypothetical protein